MQNILIVATNAGISLINSLVHLSCQMHFSSFFFFLKRLQSGTFTFSIFELDADYDTAALLLTLLLNLLLFQAIELEFRYNMMLLDVTSIHLKMLSLAYFISIVLG